MQNKIPVSLLIGGINFLPESVIKRLAGVIAFFIPLFLTKRKQVMYDNLQIAFGDTMSKERKKRIVYLAWKNLVMTLFESLRFRKHGKEYLANLATHNLELVDELMARGKGAILLAPHTGNVFLGASRIAQTYPVSVLVRPVRKPIFGPIFEDAMDAMGFEMIDRVGGLPKAVRALKKKRLLVIALDQFAGMHGIEVDFFNRGVSTFPTAAALAEKYDVPVFLGFLHRNEDCSNEATVVECVELVSTNDPIADIKTNTQLFTDKIQKIIIQHPETWMWMHRRWKDIPSK